MGSNGLPLGLITGETGVGELVVLGWGGGGAGGREAGEGVSLRCVVRAAERGTAPAGHAIGLSTVADVPTTNGCAKNSSENSTDMQSVGRPKTEQVNRTTSPKSGTRSMGSGKKKERFI